MKNIFKKSGVALAAMAMLVSCENFEEINKDPNAATVDQVQIEYFINNSIIGAQQDPHIAERAFILYWKTAGHQHLTTGISGGSANDGWSSDYYNYVSGWLNSANTAIQVAEEKEVKGNTKVYSKNMIQIARIWRVYLMSELADNFGPIAINAFQGTNPEFADLKTVYYFLLSELKDASTTLDVAVVNPGGLNNQDPAYGYNYAKWRKYANSMRLRLAMRLSEVDPAKAKAEFEAAATGDLLTDAADTFQVQEKPGWDALTGVMSREWNAQFMSVTLNNLYMGLGGVASMDQLAPSFHTSIKAPGYIGEKYFDHL